MRKFFVAFALCVGMIAGGAARTENNCTGATYYDADTDTCIACPAGYDYNQDAGKTDITQCQIHCDAGTYVETAGIVGYTQLEYIQGDANSYIDTGVYLNGNSRLEFKFLNNASGNFCVFGASNGSSWNQGELSMFWNGGIFELVVPSGSNSSFIVQPKPTNIANTEYTVSIDGEYFTINGQQIAATNWYANYQGTRPVHLFGTNRGSNVYRQNNRLYYFRIYDSNVLVNNFVPARRNSDGVVGMYDTVTGTFFTNAGTGTFIAGSNVGECVSVGAGYYAPASTVNFGSVGTKNACPVGTYSDIENASACQPCAGATYNDETGMAACKSCPAGYDYNTDAGKTDITQCQIHCDGGTWIGEYTQLEYIESTGTQYINTEISEADIDYMELDFETQSDGGYMFVNGSTQVGMQDNRYGTTTLNTRYKIKQELVGNKWYFTNITNGTTFTQPWAAGSGNLYLFALNRSSHPDNYSSAKVYGFSCYSNGSLVCNFIPARRNNDGVIGMYDTVTGTFFPNAGTGTFIAGSDIGGWCANVGAGYYAGASTVNYGSVGTRTACPAGTSTNGADNASACTPCANATYNDETGMASCKSCPTGYNYNQDAGKTDISQCQVHCDAGTYIDSVGIPVPEDYTPLEYIESTGTQYIDTGIIPRNYNYSAEFTMSASAFGKYFFGTGTSGWGGSGYQFGIANSGGSSSWGGGSASTVASGLGVSTNTFYTYKITKNGFYVNDVLKSAISNPADFAVPRSLYVGRSNNPNGGSYNNGRSKWSMVKIYDDNGAVVFDGVPARRNGDGVAGMYDTITGTFFTNSGTGTFVAGADAGATGNECVNVGVGYHAPASTVNYGSVGTRTQCPAGLYTVGYGHGADEANDCGRILHIGDNVIYTRRNKITTPSVNIQMPNGDMFYISLSPINHNVSRLHFSYGGNEYTAYDDSLYYGERNFDTGAQIVQ